MRHVHIRARVRPCPFGPFGNRGLILVALRSAEKNHNKKNVHYRWTALNALILFPFFPKEKTRLPYS